MAKKPMSMVQYERSSADRRSDKALAKRGIKEGSKREQEIDKAELKKINLERGAKRRKEK